jgi:hypothetical protein
MKRSDAQLELELEKKRNALEMSKKLIAIGIEALSLRMLTTLVLVADSALFAWALFNGGWQALATAVLFAIATWCVLHLRPPERKEEEP